MNSAMDISTSALVAQRIRLNAIASNIANMSTVRNENGDLQPFQARHVVFSRRRRGLGGQRGNRRQGRVG